MLILKKFIFILKSTNSHRVTITIHIKSPPPKISATNAERFLSNGNEFHFTGVNWLRGREDFARVSNSLALLVI